MERKIIKQLKLWKDHPERKPLAKELFAADYNIPRILLTLQAITGTNIEAGKTLIIFDELQEVRNKQREILDAYRRDISKHTTPMESMRIGQVLQSLPSQLARKNKKFIYNVLKKGARAAEYELAIQWLMGY